MSELNLTHQPFEVRDLMGGKQVIFRFPNGFGASVVRHFGSYGSAAGLWELAVTTWSGDEFELTYDTGIADDVVGHLSPAEVDEYLLRIASLNSNGVEPEAIASAPHPTSGDVPRVLKLRVRRDGGHVKVRVWMGQENSPGLCGELTMRPDEYREFRDVLMLGIQSPGPKASIYYEDDAGEWLNPSGRADCAAGCTETFAAAECPEHGVVAHLRDVFGGAS